MSSSRERGPYLLIQGRYRMDAFSDYSGATPMTCPRRKNPHQLVSVGVYQHDLVVCKQSHASPLHKSCPRHNFVVSAVFYINNAFHVHFVFF